MRRMPAARPLVALVVLLASASAEADEVDDRIQAMATKAHADYLTGEYERAATLLLDAYRLRPVAKLLFNAAKAYEKAELNAEAAKYYRLFLTQADPASSLVPNAQEALAGLPGVAPAPPTKRAREPKPRAQPTDRGRAYAAFGLAGAATIAAAAFGALALSTHADLEAEQGLSYRQELRDSAQRQALIADISWVLAAAAGVTGLLLWPGDPSVPGAGEASDTKVSISPLGALLRTTW